MVILECTPCNHLNYVIFRIIYYPCSYQRYIKYFLSLITAINFVKDTFLQWLVQVKLTSWQTHKATNYCIPSVNRLVFEVQILLLRGFLLLREENINTFRSLRQRMISLQSKPKPIKVFNLLSKPRFHANISFKHWLPQKVFSLISTFYCSLTILFREENNVIHHYTVSLTGGYSLGYLHSTTFQLPFKIFWI